MFNTLHLRTVIVFDDPEGFVAGRPALDMSALDQELSELDDELGETGPDDGPADSPPAP